MPAGVLAYSVTLRGDNFQLVTFPAGSTPPAWAQAQISNPKAWEGSEAPSASAPEPPGDGPPPKGGAGSGKDAWAAYAASKDVDVDQDATRDEIIAALEVADVPTE